MEFAKWLDESFPADESFLGLHRTVDQLIQYCFLLDAQDHSFTDEQNKF